MSGVTISENPPFPTTMAGLPKAIPRRMDCAWPTTTSATAYAGPGSTNSPVRMTARRPSEALTRSAFSTSRGWAGPDPTMISRTGDSLASSSTAWIDRSMPSSLSWTFRRIRRDTMTMLGTPSSKPQVRRNSEPSTEGCSRATSTGGSSTWTRPLLIPCTSRWTPLHTMIKGIDRGRRR